MIPGFVFTDGVTVYMSNGEKFKADEVEVYDRHIVCIQPINPMYKYLNPRYIKAIIAKEWR